MASIIWIPAFAGMTEANRERRRNDNSIGLNADLPLQAPDGRRARMMATRASDSAFSEISRERLLAMRKCVMMKNNPKTREARE